MSQDRENNEIDEMDRGARMAREVFRHFCTSEGIRLPSKSILGSVDLQTPFDDVFGSPLWRWLKQIGPERRYRLRVLLDAVLEDLDDGQ